MTDSTEANVVRLEDYRHDPHISALLKCGACTHEWVGIRRIDGELPWVTCPKCQREQGFPKRPISVALGTEIFRCGCGNEFMTITRKGPLCASCGLLHDGFNF